MLNFGLSGCKFELLSDNQIRKYSSNKEYNSRLLTQADKQEFFSNLIFTHIDTAKVNFKKESELSFFDMEYISGYNYEQYFSFISASRLKTIIISLEEYFSFLVENSKKYDSNIVRKKIISKLSTFSNSRYNKIIDFTLNYLNNIDIDIEKSFCHGDLTMTNILFNHKRIYLIDFLDSYLDTFLLDLVKLKQDLYYYWILEICDSKNLRVIQSFNHIWNFIEQRYKKYLNLDIFHVLDLINFLRIEPYLTNNNQRIILDKIIKKTYLYEEFARSNGREIFKISKY